MDTEQTIAEIEWLERTFAVPDTRPLRPSDLSTANRRHDEANAHSPRFRLWQRYGVYCRPESPVAAANSRSPTYPPRSFPFGSNIRIPDTGPSRCTRVPWTIGSGRGAAMTTRSVPFPSTMARRLRVRTSGCEEALTMCPLADRSR